MKILFTFLLFQLSLATSLFAQWELRQAIEFQSRDGLPNLFYKIKSGEKVNVGFIGGSITEADGWRTKIIAWMQEYYKNDSIFEYNAAIGGTDSKYGVYRIDRHLLDKKEFDLIFVEFAVNDNSWISSRIERSMEGIVRKIWTKNPKTDICFIYTSSSGFLEDVKKGKMNLTASIHDSIAAYYGVPSIFLSLETNRLIVNNISVWSDQISNKETSQNATGQYVFTTDNVHPTNFGHQVYTDVISKNLKTIDTKTGISPHKLPPPLIKENYSNAKMLRVSKANNHGMKFIEKPGEIAYLDKYLLADNSKFLVADDTTTDYSFSFKGSEIGFHLLIGPSTGKYIVEIDGMKNELKSFNPYCSNYWRYYEFFTVNAEKEHFVKIYPSKNNLTLSEKRAILNTEIQKLDLDNNPSKYLKNELLFSDIFIDGELTNFFIDSISICKGDSLIWQNKTYKIAGEYNTIFKMRNGYDSIYQLQLQTHTQGHLVITDSIYAGDSIRWEGKVIKFPGEYSVTYSTINKCDSIIELKMRLKNKVYSNTTSEYLFEEYNGLTVFDSKGHNNGTITKNAHRVAGKKGSGLKFDGNGYINLGKCFGDNVQNSISISAWIKPELFGTGWQGVVMHGSPSLDNFALYVNPENKKIVFRTRNTIPEQNQWIEVTSTQLWDGNWHHLAAIYDGVNKSIYVDGILQKKVISSGIIESGAGYNMYIGAGREFNFNTTLFHGTLDEVKIFNYGVSIEEIMTATFGEIPNTEDFIFYPNPASSKINVGFINSSVSEVVVEILDSKGILQLKENVSQFRNAVNTSTLKPGLYLIRFRTKTKNKTEKLMIM